MKIARVFGWIFGIIGMVLMVGAVALALMSLDAPVRMTDVPREATERSEQMMQAIAQGDYAAASRLMYGQPELGAGRMPATPEGILIWNAFQQSITYEFQGPCYATETGISRNVTVTTLDISSVTANLPARASALLTARVEAAEEMSELYDENNNFREDLIAEVLQEAVLQALKEDAKTVTYEIRLDFVCQDGQWWIIPQPVLLQAIAGGVM